MKKVLLVTGGFFHPPFFGRLVLHRTLRQMAGFSFLHVPSLERLPSDLEQFSAMVLHFHHKKISSTALQRLDNFVKNGGGILAIHAATASFKETLPYFEILGGRFTGHGAVENLVIQKVRGDIFPDIDDFTVKDELYIHELQPGIETHFTANHAGKDIPAVWTHRYHKGKVCYSVPGHTTGSMRNTNYQRLLQRGLTWVAE